MKYRTIVADPPWDYSEGFANNPKPGTKGWKPLPYPSMSVWQIAALPIADLAEKDCRLFLWTTNRYLRDSFMVLDAWGFKYAQTLVWHKTGNPSPFGGSVAPIHAEYVLVGKKGSPATLSRIDSSVIAANVGDHSAKPEGFLDRFEAISPGPYLELFARRNRMGWDTWGNQSLEHVELAS